MLRSCSIVRLSSPIVRPVASVPKLCDLTSQLSLNSSSPAGDRNPLTNYESRRFGRRYRKWFSWPNDFLPFKWSRPELEPPYLRTGDAVRDIGIWDPNELVPGAEHSKELQNAPEIVRRLFSLGFAERKDVVEFQRRKIVKFVQRHPFDENSHEVKIANFTVKIRNNLHHFTKIDKYDAPRKIRQNTCFLKRAVLLKELYYQDRERYEYIKSLLGITHTPPKLGVPNEVPTRKGELRRLTRELCDGIKEKRLAEYHDELKQKRATLEEDIEKVNQLIQEEEKYLGIQNPAPLKSA